MADPHQIQTDPKKPEIKTNLSPELQDLRGKSFREIVKEGQTIAAGTPADDAAKKEEEEKKAEAAKAAEEAKVQEENKRKEEEARRAEEQKKHDEEIATRASEAALAKREEEEKKRKEAEAGKKQEDEELKPVWLRDPNWPYKDKDGNPVPKDYAQQAEEITRISDLRAQRSFDAKMKAREAEEEKQRQAKAAEEERKKQVVAQMDKQLDDELQSDLKDLYSTDKLPKIKDEKDPNDPGILARKQLFETGVKVNTERAAKGLPPIRSIKIIFYEHYKPDKQLPGGDAPIQPGGTPSATKRNPDEFNFVTDHRKSMRQVLAEAKARLSGKK